MGQIRFLNSKTTDLDWYYSRPNKKLKFLIRDLLHALCESCQPTGKQWDGLVDVQGESFTKDIISMSQIRN